MPQIEPRPREDLAAHEPVFQAVETMMGFVPNSMTTMAIMPGLLEGFGAMGLAIMSPQGQVDIGLKQLVAFCASRSAGCQYCMAHTAHSAAKAMGGSEKLDKIWEYESDPAFSEAERAALRMAQAAGRVPNAVTDAHFADLRAHFSEAQIVELVAVVSLFGFLNRWNDTMATELESSPTAFGKGHLAGRGWAPGKHGGEGNGA